MLPQKWLQIQILRNGKSSQECPVDTGLPQDSSFGPIFHLIINDLSHKSFCYQFFIVISTLYSKCGWTSDLQQQLELSPERKSEAL